MPEKVKPNKPVTWIVVIRANLDDVICGAYPTCALARLRMRQVLKDPHAEQAENKMQAWDVSGAIGVAIYRASGDTVKFWDQVNCGDDEKAAA